MRDEGHAPCILNISQAPLTPIPFLKPESPRPATVVNMNTDAEHDTIDTTRDLPLLHEWAGRLGAPLTELQLDSFRVYRDELLAWNTRRANLTSIAEPQEVETRLFLESLWCAGALPATADLRIVDIGSGGGFPGVPLAIAFPRLDVARSLRPRARRFGSLNTSSGSSASGIATLFRAAQKTWRMTPNTVRSTTSQQPAGLLLCPLSWSCACHLSASAAASSPPKGRTLSRRSMMRQTRSLALGGEAEGIILPDPDTPIPTDHRLVLISKSAPTPYQYPRRNGVPAQRPL